MNRNRIRRVIKIKDDHFLFFLPVVGGEGRDFSDFAIFFLEAECLGFNERSLD